MVAVAVEVACLFVLLFTCGKVFGITKVCGGASCVFAFGIISTFLIPRSRLIRSIAAKLLGISLFMSPNDLCTVSFTAPILRKWVLTLSRSNDCNSYGACLEIITIVAMRVKYIRMWWSK